MKFFKFIFKFVVDKKIQENTIMLAKTILKEKEELALKNKLLKQSDNIAIPEYHKKIVRERVLEAKTMVDWDEVKNTF